MLSRLPLPQSESKDEALTELVFLTEAMEEMPITVQQIKQWTKEDSELSKVYTAWLATTSPQRAEAIQESVVSVIYSKWMHIMSCDTTTGKTTNTSGTTWWTSRYDKDEESSPDVHLVA